VIAGRVLALICALAVPTTAARQVYVVVDRDTRAYRQAIEGIERAGHHVTRLEADDARTAAALRALPRGTLALSMGPRSTRLLAASGSTEGAALFVRGDAAPAGLPAVTLEVPYEQQLGWIKAAFPGRRRLIVLRQPGSAALDDVSLQETVRTAGLELILADVATAGDAVPALEAALRGQRRGALVWLLPDPVAISTSTVAPLIQTALASRVPVVGFSDYFLRVGAIAAVSVDYGACGLQALRLAAAGAPVHAPPASARLLVAGRLAERLGIAVREAPGVEIRR